MSECVHKWKVIKEAVALPLAWGARLNSTASSEILERLVKGSTSIIAQCERCGALDTKTVPGVPQGR